MIKVVRVYELDKDSHVLSIVADDKGFTYVLPKKGKPIFDPQARVKLLMEKAGDTKKFTVDDYLSLGSFGLSMYRFSRPFEENDKSMAVKSEQLSLDKSFQFDQTNNVPNISDTYDDIFQVFNDYPDLYDQLASEDPDQEISAEGMTELVFALFGEISPGDTYGYILDHLDSSQEKPVTAAAEADACPPATQDIELNLKNRQHAIDNVGYGPLNPDEPNDEFWQAKADRWSVSPDEARKSRCGNCAAFIQTSKMKECIAQGLEQGDPNAQDSWDVVAAGDLGYCQALDFKCAASRTCDAWIVGGPVTDETGKE